MTDEATDPRTEGEVAEPESASAARPEEFPCLLGIVGVASSPAASRSALACAGPGCYLWSRLGSEDEGGRPGTCLIARVMAGVARKIEGTDVLFGYAMEETT